MGCEIQPKRMGSKSTHSFFSYKKEQKAVLTSQVKKEKQTKINRRIFKGNKNKYLRKQRKKKCYQNPAESRVDV